MLKIDNLCKSYGSKKILNNLSFTIESGEIFGFVGPNGAGKTTTLKILSGILKANGGKMLYDDIDLLKKINLLKSKIGYMPDFFGVYDNLRVDEYLNFYGSIYNIDDKVLEKRIDELLYLVSLEGKKESYVDNLSRGMKQRLCLARTLIHDPEIILLDEPASGLDPRTRSDLKEILRQLSLSNKTVIVSSHILSELTQMCTNIGIIDNGKMVISGKVDEILNKVDESNPLIITILNQKEKAIELLRKSSLVKTLTSEDNKILITFTGNRDEEAQLLRELVMNEVGVLSFGREQGNLESLFLEITGGQQ